jgi:Fic family protein
MKYADTDIHIDEVLLKKVEEKKKRLDNLRPLPQEALKKLLEDIRLRHTYHSDAIEGNTLTLQETKLVIEEIHERVTRGTLEESGKYRTQNVRIAGSKTTPPSYTKIVKLMEEYISNIKELKLHSIKKAAFIHYELVRIHPFLDGNGRVSRLITNLYLMKQGYPPIILKKEDRGKYYQVLQRADDGDLSPFANFIAQAVHEALMYYLSSFVDDERLIPLKEIADFSPYSQEYLSLRARQGKLDAVKIENVWYSSKRALKEYLKSLR